MKFSSFGLKIREDYASEAQLCPVFNSELVSVFGQVPCVMGWFVSIVRHIIGVLGFSIHFGSALR